MTVYDYIQMRWPNHAQRIIECAMEYDRAHAEYTLVREVDEYVRGPSPKNVLEGLFIWMWTTEGFEYWKALSQGESVDANVS